MEIRLRSIFLATALAFAILPATEVAAQSAEDESGGLIEPQIERVEFDESIIDSYDIEVALYGGYLAIHRLPRFRGFFRAGLVWQKRGR